MTKFLMQFFPLLHVGDILQASDNLSRVINSYKKIIEGQVINGEVDIPATSSTEGSAAWKPSLFCFVSNPEILNVLLGKCPTHCSKRIVLSTLLVTSCSVIFDRTKAACGYSVEVTILATGDNTLIWETVVSHWLLFNNEVLCNSLAKQTCT